MGPNKILQQIKTCTDPPFIYKGPVDGTVQVFEWQTVLQAATEFARFW